MGATIVEQVFGRVYSKGVKLLINLDPPPAAGGDGIVPTSPLNAWLAGFTRVGGVKSIGGPNASRDILELQELDVGPATLVTGEVPENFYYKNKAPGDKDYQAIPIMLNMSHQQMQTLWGAYNSDITFGFQIVFPTGALMLGLGFVDSLEPTIESSKIVEVAFDLQPAFGIDYISNCAGYNTLHGFWANYLPLVPCPA